MREERGIYDGPRRPSTGWRSLVNPSRLLLITLTVGMVVHEEVEPRQVLRGNTLAENGAGFLEMGTAACVDKNNVRRCPILKECDEVVDMEVLSDTRTCSVLWVEECALGNDQLSIHELRS